MLNKWTLIFSFPGLVSLCTLTLLAYERYNVVCRPRAGLKLSIRRSIIGLLFVWIYCLFWAVTPLFGWSSYGPEGVQTSCSLAWEERSWSNYSYLILYTLLCFIFPVIVIIYCYSKVLTSMDKVGSCWRVHIYYTLTPLEQELEFIPPSSSVCNLPPTDENKLRAFNGCQICFLLVAEQECGAPGWAFQPEGE